MQGVLYRYIDGKCDKFDAIQKTQLWMALSSVGRGDEKAVSMLSGLDKDDFDNLQKTIFQLNIAEIKEIIANEKPFVSIWWRADCIGNIFLSLAKRLCKEEAYNYLGLVAIDYVSDRILQRVSEFNIGNYLAIPKEENLSYLGFLGLVVFPEDYIASTHFPKDVVRVVQPHGLDIPMDNSVVKYGAGFTCDYVLSPMKEQNDSRDKYIGLFPSALVEHNSKYIHSIPAGYPKLDEFFSVCSSVPMKKKIIYHISLLGVETEIVRENIGATLGFLLENFPDREILFRPDQTDNNNPILLDQISKWVNHPNLVMSKSASYINDYADAEVLVTHRLVTAHTFAFASKRPIVAYTPSDSPSSTEETNVGYRVYSLDELKKVILSVMENPSKEKDKIQNYLDQTIYNPGCSIDYIVESIPYMLQRGKRDEWVSFRLYKDSEKISAIDEVVEALKNNELLGGRNVCLAEAATAKFPNNAMFRLHIAKALTQFKNPFEHVDYFRRWGMALSHITYVAENISDFDENTRRDILQWILTDGIAVAMNIKYYENLNGIKLDYSVDDFLNALCKLDRDRIVPDRLFIRKSLASRVYGVAVRIFVKLYRRFLRKIA